MPFEVGEAINSFTDRFIKLPLVKRIAHNPIYTAMVITFIMILIVMFVFRDVESDESLLALCMRSGFYLFVFLVGIIVIHNKVLIGEITATTTSEEMNGMFKGSYSGIVTGEDDGEINSLEDSIIPVPVNVPTY